LHLALAAFEAISKDVAEVRVAALDDKFLDEASGEEPTIRSLAHLKERVEHAQAEIERINKFQKLFKVCTSTCRDAQRLQ
jgi:hypothetical protein